MFRFLNFRNLKKKTEKRNTELLSFGQTYIEFYGCHGNIKSDGHLIDMSKFPQRMKELQLKVSVPGIKSPFQNFKKTL